MVLRKAKHDKAPSARAGQPERTSLTDSEDVPATQTCPVVGVGASAGGLDAFKRLFTTMPSDCGVAFVLIQHLDPTRKSRTVELVGSYTPMGVVEARSGMKVEPNQIYVIPPNKYLRIRDRTLRLSKPAAPRSLRMAIDCFLRSLAGDQQEKAIGVVLSGTGTDGTLGLKEVKAAGGMTMVQDPQTAEHDGMPRSAIAGGCADYVVPAEEMADALLAYARHAPILGSDAEALSSPTPDSLSSIVSLLQSSADFDFSGYRKGTLRRRIRRRMGLRRVGDAPEYVELLHGDPAEVAALFKDLLLTVTSFFREPAAWQFLKARVIRPLVAARHDGDTVRAWIPACATGEEAYSLAMTLVEELQDAKKNCGMQLFASDVAADALETARAGIYPETIAADVSPERLSRFFTRNGHRYEVKKQLRDAVVFARQNLVADPPFSRLDLITCRNLLIYLEPALQERLIAFLHFALGEGGCLFLGGAEGIGQHEDLFEVVSKKWRIYRRVGPARHDMIRAPAATFPVSPVVPFAPGPPPPQPSENRLPALAQQLLLSRYVPACVFINRNSEIVYFYGETDEYLVQPPGAPTNDVVEQARDGLRAKLRAAIGESLRAGKRVVSAGAHVRRGSAYPRVTITVEPVDGVDRLGGFWLVSFEDEPEMAGPVSTRESAAPVADTRLVDHLEYELKSTKEDLQQTIEELRASNEELMSVNEELQSSNEELETSKEELQSLNEELTTSNVQLESKIGELEAANDDLDNLLTSTSIATLFLDTELCVRRFTPAATELFGLIATDIGRPLADVSGKFTDPDLLSDAEAVLDQRMAPSREVRADSGRHYVRQALPYQTHDGRIEGVVITISDIAEEVLQEARLYAEAIVDTVREPLLVLDNDLYVVSANRAFYAGFRIPEDETVGRPLYELGSREWDIPQLRTALTELLPRKRVLTDFEVTHEFRSLGQRVMLLSARALVRGGGRPELILLAIEDLTERRRIQGVLQETEARKDIDDKIQQRQAQLAHALRVSTMGELASGLAHQLNQPLSAIANNVEACARFVGSGSADSKELLRLLRGASDEAVRAAEIVEHLRQFIRKGEPQRDRADLADIIIHMAQVLGHELQRERVVLRIDVQSKSLRIHADRIQIEQVLVNVIQNAIDSVRGARGEDRELELVARVVQGMAEVSVRDRGAGVSEETARRLFEPFFTTKPAGLGLGLAISRSIMEAHHGRMWADLPPDGGSGLIVRFTLPLLASKASRKRSRR